MEPIEMLVQQLFPKVVGNTGTLAECLVESWLRKSEHRDKWSFCLKAASMRAA
jgi:hypothetical protein